MAERRPTGLAARIALLTTGVTVLAVLVSFLVSAELVRGAADTQARRTLGHYADLLAAGTIAPVAERNPLRRGAAPVKPLYAAAQITPMVVRADGSVGGRYAGQLPRTVVGEAAAGRPVDATATFAGRGWFLAARPLADGRGSLVLAQPRSVAQAIASPLRGRLVLALLVGLAVAVSAGLALSRRLARPLTRAAAAAAELAAGSRDVRLPEEGPREVAGVAAALNSLAGALATSEGRQREFLLSVSHELRTPLTAVSGYAEALADGVLPADEVPRVGGTLLGESAHLQRIVDDLLDLARLGAVDFRVELAPVDLGALVLGAQDVWAERCARTGAVLRVELPPVPVVVVADAGRVRQILDGLAENALRVVPPGAPLVLAVRAAPGAGVLEVRDGGPGLTPDDIAVAFERSALHDRYRGVRRVGTGIGLALIAGLVERMGGRQEAGSAPEGGARFTVELPAAGPGSA
ncbi:two-component system sensor histidine kinase BaeS [Motilibacter rhizosphaerae]|uniref:histidine kinase n=1 Tax=Motilibacter rhizosphaerae TaxID=598652 RepID=A0A4Q7NS05_9ACTN|nr:HAMP domain-containing sensor histidine kinase [Motilibacter rhizosphaerae]RZS89867.1 two-component system sensor histidine kinase BaeS [Motilibacter rhizosphaerae]